MSRWHKVTCKAPDIYVDGEIPRCQVCDSAPDLRCLIRDRSKSAAPWEAPPDEQIGKFNLHWPSCVPYRRLQEIHQPPKAKLNNNSELVSSAPRSKPTPAPTAINPTTIPEIYKESPKLDELRLVCMNSAPTDREAYPIHISLEVYSDDHCPEYEAVSYAWGGEDGNKDQTHPIYVGEFWDVLLQTKNCWQALQYLRPYRGIRMIWIDAVCINQENVIERDEQVSKMREIYSRCLRAVVWLGDEIAKKPSQPNTDKYTYPTRRSIADLVPANTCCQNIDLTEILRLKYFQRIWIIQELILPAELIIPVQGMEFLANHSKLRQLDHLWENTATPWFENVCTGNSNLFQNPYDIMRQTWRSCATDPRDMIFGILGLISVDTPPPQIKPDYTLSNSEVYIGLAAHILLNLKRCDVLLGLLPQNKPRPIPSWVFVWENHDDIKFAWKMRNMYESFLRTGFWSLDPVKYRWHRLITRTPRGGHVIKIPTRNMKLYWTRSFFQWNPGARWYHNASLDPFTATLSINLTHLLDFDSRPKELESFSHEGTTLRVSEIEMGESCLWLITAGDVPLESAIAPGLTEVFALFREDIETFFVLFLRRTGSGDRFTVLFSCLCDDLYIYVPTTCLHNDPVTNSCREKLSFSERISDEEKIFQAQGLLFEGVLSCQFFLDISRTNKDAILHINRLIQHWYHKEDSKVQLEVFIGSSDFWDNLPVFQALLDDEFDGTSHKFRDCYLSFLQTAAGKYGSVTTASDSSEIRVYLGNDHKFQNLPSAQDLRNPITYGSPVWEKGYSYGLYFHYTRWDTLVYEIRKSRQYEILVEMTAIRKLTGEKETRILYGFLNMKYTRDGVPEEWKDGIFMSWPRCAQNDFNIDLRITRVNIS